MTPVAQERNGSNGDKGWRTAALSAMGGILLLFAGWGFTSAQITRGEATTAIIKLQDQRSTDLQRVAVLEESVRALQAQLTRIESGVDELRRKR